MSHDRTTDFKHRANIVVSKITLGLGSFVAIFLATFLILMWVVGLFIVSNGFENNLYQLAINTITTIITFLMVFVIQNSQNRDSLAIQAKLDAIIQATSGVSDDLVGVEELTHKEIKAEKDSLRSKASSPPK